MPTASPEKFSQSFANIFPTSIKNSPSKKDNLQERHSCLQCLFFASSTEALGSWRLVGPGLSASLAARYGQEFGSCQQDIRRNLMRSSWEVCLPPAWCLEGPWADHTSSCQPRQEALGLTTGRYSTRSDNKKDMPSLTRPLFLQMFSCYMQPNINPHNFTIPHLYPMVAKVTVLGCWQRRVLF